MSTVVSDELTPTKPLGRRAGNNSGMDAVPDERKPAGIVCPWRGNPKGQRVAMSPRKSPRRGAGLGSALLAAQGVLQTADGILYLSGGLVRLSFRFQLCIAGDLAGHFLDGSLGLLGRAFDPILVHVYAFRWGSRRLINSGRVTKFISAAQVARTST